MITTDRQRDLIDLIDYARLGYEKYKKEFQKLEAIYTSVMDAETLLILKKQKNHACFSIRHKLKLDVCLIK